MRFCCVLIFHLFSVCVALSQNAAIKIDSLLNTYYSYSELNGCVLVAEGEKVIYKNAFGKANFEWNIPNTIDTRFEIASMAKPITAIIVLQLVQEGKIRLDAPISTYLPEYPKEKGSKITVRHLLLHTSGLTDHRFIENFDNEYGTKKMDHGKFVSIFKDKDLLFEPGTKWSYSNFGYNLLAFIAEKITNRSFDQLIKERIFIPGKMNSSSCASEIAIPKMANPYEMRFSEIKKGRYYDASSTFGISGIITTVEDYFSFHRALLSGKLLSKPFLDSLLSPYSELSGEVTGYNFWFDKLALKNSDTTTILRAAGNMFGWHSLAYNIKKDDKFIVMFLNVRNPKLFEIADNITNILFDLPYQAPKNNCGNVFFSDEQRMGLPYAVEHYKELKTKKICTQKFRDLNRLGYFYLESSKTDNAIQVFKLNCEAFPDDAGVYDSLAEAYLIAGKKNLAITNYKRSIELDPKNENAIQMLDRIKSQ